MQRTVALWRLAVVCAASALLSMSACDSGAAKVGPANQPPGNDLGVNGKDAPGDSPVTTSYLAGPHRAPPRRPTTSPGHDGGVERPDVVTVADDDASQGEDATTRAPADAASATDTSASDAARDAPAKDVTSNDAHARDAATSDARTKDAATDASPVSGNLTVAVTLTDNDHDVRVVDPDGVVYAIDVNDDDTRIWASMDNARTWSLRGQHPRGSTFLAMTTLADGTLLADTVQRNQHAISRSTDHGATWQDVLPLGQYQMLQPHNIRELNGTVFLAEYQAFALEAPIHLWVSTDQGATWTTRYTFDGMRHAHSLVSDPPTGTLWALMGDATGALLRSHDAGYTWEVVIDNPNGVAVDAVVTPSGLLFGTDVLYQPPLPTIARVNADGSETFLMDLPGPSYSIMSLAGGGYLLGETREPDGDVYAPMDISAHLFASADGVVWNEVYDFTRMFPDDYARADVHWRLNSGEIVLELYNVETLVPSGRGFKLLSARITTGP